MPIYEYECKACGHRLEKLQKISASPLTDCPSCHTAELTRLVSAAGFRLAGGGWYETDFKSGSKKNLAGDSTGSHSSDSSSNGAATKVTNAKSEGGGSQSPASIASSRDGSVA